MSPERKQRLDSVEGWVWDPHKAGWEEGFSRFLKYVDEKGNGLVPMRYKDPADDFKLGQWVSHQRKFETTMSPERKQRLDSVEGWVWDPLKAAWEEGFSRLLKYVDEKGNGLVPMATPIVEFLQRPTSK